jgi:serine/threonine-protein kinase HipA
MGPVEEAYVRMARATGAVEASPNMPSLDCGGFFSATLSIARDLRDIELDFRRLVFNILAHNRDSHVRQHAYLMDADGQGRGEWQLAPTFDLTFSHGPIGEHYMAVMGEDRAITRDAIEALGARHGIAPKRVAAIIEEVRGGLNAVIVCNVLARINGL